MAPRNRRKFGDEFKQEVVRFTGRATARLRTWPGRLELTEPALRGWVKQHDVDRGKGPSGALTSRRAVAFAKRSTGSVAARLANMPGWLRLA